MLCVHEIWYRHARRRVFDESEVSNAPDVDDCSNFVYKGICGVALTSSFPAEKYMASPSDQYIAVQPKQERIRAVRHCSVPIVCAQRRFGIAIVCAKAVVSRLGGAFRMTWCSMRGKFVRRS